MQLDAAGLEAAFAAAMARLGPLGPAPKLALAVSGGADSMALAELARRWAGGNDATVLALVADHGLREGAAAEAAWTAGQLVGRGLAVRVLRLECKRGAALQARARAARHAALAAAAREAGCVVLLLGHHAADQAETVAMRGRRGSGGGGEGMASWAARRDVILLRPLLGIAPAALRGYLRRLGIGWIEDPSNADPRFERARLRAEGVSASAADPAARQAAERAAAGFLARHATLRPEGYAVIAADTAPVAALAGLLRAIGGQDYPPARAAVAALAARLRPATLGGVQIARAKGGWLLAREPAACAAAVPAGAGAVWDRRFRLQTPLPGARFGALGDDMPVRRLPAGLPALVRRGLPCLRLGGEIIFPAPAIFVPPAPVTSHPFLA